MNLIGTMSFVDSIADFGTSPELDGAFDVETARINGTTYVYVAGRNDAGIQVFSIDRDGELTPVTAIADTVSIGLDGVAELEVLQVGREYFLAASSTSDQVTTFRIDDDGDRTDGHLVPVARYANFPPTGEGDAGAGIFDYPEFISEAVIGGTQYLFSSAYTSGAIGVFRVTRDGELVRTDTASDADDPDYRLQGARDIEPYKIGNKTFLFVGSDVETGISVFEVNDRGKLSFVQAVDGANDPYQILPMEFNGKDYLFVSEDTQDSIVVYSIARNGELSKVSETPRFIDGNYSDIWKLEALEMDGVPYVLASAANQDTLLVLSLDAEENIEIVQTYTDGTELDYPRGIETLTFGDSTYVLTAAQNADRLTVLEIGANDDPLTGTAEDDRIVGGIGEDDLLGLAGNDEMFGGSGEDVLSGRAGKDMLYGQADDDILAGGAGNDVLEGGLGRDVLSGGGGTDTASYAGSEGAVDVNLATGDATGGDAEGDMLISIENLTGSARADKLTGDDEKNILNGGKGNDTIEGGGGNDDIRGGGGNDALNGGEGRDKINGQGGADDIDGGEGNDRLIGGGGNDDIDGGAGDDDIKAGGGSDTITGGVGDDEMSGQGGADTFVIRDGDGSDTIRDFSTASDVVDLSGVSSVGSFRDLNLIDVAGTAVLLLDGGDSLSFSDIRSRDLSNDNFDFGA